MRTVKIVGMILVLVSLIGLVFSIKMRHNRAKDVPSCVQFDEGDPREAGPVVTEDMVCDITKAGSLPAHITCCSHK